MGLNVTVVAVFATVPTTRLAPCLTVKLVAVSVLWSMASEKVALTVVFTATPVVVAGRVELAVGGITSPLVV